MENNAIFLGNGFNLAIGVNTSYKALYCSMIGKDFLKGYLPTEPDMETQQYDLEAILFADEKSKALIEYHLFEGIVNKCKTIISQHQNLMKYLCSFDKFFSTNYDPLLYHNLLLLKESEFEEDVEFTQELEAICQQKINDFEIINLTKKNIHSIASKIFSRNSSFSNKKMLDYMETLKKIKDEAARLPIKDGFVIQQSGESKGKQKERYMTWDEVNSNQNIFYLHGSLHIYKEDGKIRKYITNNRKVDFINQIQQHSSDNFSNLSAVFCNKSEDKLKKIRENRYLKYCIEKLSKLEGKLTIIGWSFSENDRHLINAINKSELDNIEVFYYREKPQSPFTKQTIFTNITTLNFVKSK